MKLKGYDIDIRSPISLDECKERDRLLALSLREGSLPFSIAKEYPLVLDPADTSKSFCVFFNGHVIAHANLFHRECVLENVEMDYPAKIIITLIGNVATHPEWRAKGIMRALFNHLELCSRNSHSAALILWSDLNFFYEKLGFIPWGKEIRYDISREKVLSCFVPSGNHFSSEVDLNILNKLLRTRCAVPTLKRSAREFKKLLGIPWTDFKMAKNISSGAYCYGVVGKGADMQGVMHEWGAENELGFLALSSSFFSHENMKKLTLLCPGTLEEKWRIFFNSLSTLEKVYPMCLLKILQSKHSKTLENLFIWGLDSI